MESHRLLSLLRFLVAALAGACLASGGFAEEQEEPLPGLCDIATGEQIPGADTVATKNFGAVVRTVTGPSARSLRLGDVILAVDGWRTFGFREFQIARFKQ